MKLAILSSIILLVQPPLSQERKQGEDQDVYAVIVNEKNTCTQTGNTAKATIKKLFLKQTTKWSDGTDAKPYGRKHGDVEEAAFLKEILSMGDAELARHWLRMKNLEGTTPPKGVSSDRMLLKYVQKYEGAFGVIKISETTGVKGIKILCRF